MNDGQYHYYLKNNQGNNRVIINSSGKPEETNHYYPFGGTFANSTSVQQYKYNSKEYDSKKGLNWYDYGARHYDAALGRWHAVDPLAEKYCSTNQYAYCLNNPANRIDPSGMASYYNWDNQRYEDEKGNEVSWESLKRQHGIGQTNLPDDPPTASDVDGVTRAAPIVSKMNLYEIQGSADGLITGEPSFLPGFSSIKSVNTLWKVFKSLLKSKKGITVAFEGTIAFGQNEN